METLGTKTYKYGEISQIFFMSSTSDLPLVYFSLFHKKTQGNLSHSSLFSQGMVDLRRRVHIKFISSFRDKFSANWVEVELVFLKTPNLRQIKTTGSTNTNQILLSLLTEKENFENILSLCSDLVKSL